MNEEGGDADAPLREGLGQPVPGVGHREVVVEAHPALIDRA